MTDKQMLIGVVVCVGLIGCIVGSRVSDIIKKDRTPLTIDLQDYMDAKGNLITKRIHVDGVTRGDVKGIRVELLDADGNVIKNDKKKVAEKEIRDVTETEHTK